MQSQVKADSQHSRNHTVSKPVVLIAEELSPATVEALGSLATSSGR
jgi:hypothetical protein